MTRAFKYRLRLRAVICAGVACVLILAGLAPGMAVAPLEANQRKSPSSATREEKMKAAKGAYGRIPASIEPNVGQAPPDVRFLSRSGAGTTLFASSGLVLPLRAATSDDNGKASAPVKVSFQGARRTPELAAQGKLEGIVNYLVGQDPSQWRTEIPTYRKVTYRRLYPGIDLTYEGVRRGMKSTYFVAPNARPDQIRWRYEGAKSQRVDSRGNLRIQLDAESRASGERVKTMVEQAPVAWQGSGKTRRSVEATYKLNKDGSVGFSLGKYDPRAALIIDPTLVYATYLGGSANDWGHAVAVDGAENAYVAGSTLSTDFKTTPGASQTAAPECRRTGALDDCKDGFVSKINPSGTGLVYSTILGSTRSDLVHGIWVDDRCTASCPAFVTGASQGHFPTTEGAFQRTNVVPVGTQTDVFITQLSADGSDLVYSTLVEPRRPSGWVNECDSDQRETAVDQEDYGSAIAVEGQEGSYNAFVVGATQSHQFPMVEGSSPQPEHSCTTERGEGDSYNFDAFALKMALKPNNDAADSDPDDLLFSTFLGAKGEDRATGLALDGADAFVVVGNSVRTGTEDNTPQTFPTSEGAPNRTPGVSGTSDAFVVKLRASSPEPYIREYATLLGGCHDDLASDVVVDSDSNTYVTGFTRSFTRPDESSPDPPDDFPANRLGSDEETCQSEDDVDAFLVGLNPSGSAFLFDDLIGGTGEDRAGGIDLGPGQDVYLSGSTTSAGVPGDSPAFPTTPDAFQRDNKGLEDVFLMRLARTDRSLLFSTLLGGSGREVQRRDPHPFYLPAPVLAVDESGDAYVAGTTSSSDFPTRAGEPGKSPFQPANAGVTTSGRLEQVGSDPCRERGLERSTADPCDVFVAKIGEPFTAAVEGDGTEVDDGTEGGGTDDRTAGGGAGAAPRTETGAAASPATGVPARPGQLPATGPRSAGPLFILAFSLVSCGFLMVRRAKTGKT